MRLLATLALALSSVTLPALAQDRTPPTTDLRAYSPPIDWTVRPQPGRDDVYGLSQGRSMSSRQIAPLELDHR